MILYEDARSADLPALTSLWQTCFGDSKESIQEFWSCLFPHIRVCVAREGKKICAMCCILPVSLVDDCGETYQAAYLYALGTAPAMRKRGLGSSLLEYANKSLRREGIPFSLLVPSEPSLFTFYEKLGYRTAFYQKEDTIPAGERQAQVTPMNADSYSNLRQLMLYGSFVSYSTELLNYQMQLGKGSKAGLFRIELDHCLCCAAAEKRGDTLLIKELLPSEPEAAAALAHQLGCQQAVMRSEGTDHPFGMIKALGEVPPPENAYLGLAFD